MISTSSLRMKCTMIGFTAALMLAGSTIAAPAAMAAAGATSSTITLSGVVSDTSGLTLAGIQVKLTGGAQMTMVTDLSGAYSFAVKPGSYTVSVSGLCAAFEPPLMNLNNLTTDAVADFVGSGGQCSVLTSSGATSGSFTISGTVTSAGHPIAGAHVSLNGGTQAFRTSDQAGGYSFHVNRGSYSVSVAGGCNSYAPSVVNLNNVTHSLAQNFIGSGNCPIAPLTMCPTLDTLFLGSSEPASCDLMSSPDCAFDRASTWGLATLVDFAGPLFDDCRFGGWFTGSHALTQAELATYMNDLSTFLLYFFGCPAMGTENAPLSFQLIPRAFGGRTFTTAEITALSSGFLAAVTQGVNDYGLPPLTSTQTAAITSQINFLASRVPHVVSSSAFNASTCQ